MRKFFSVLDDVLCVGTVLGGGLVAYCFVCPPEAGAAQPAAHVIASSVSQSEPTGLVLDRAALMLAGLAVSGLVLGVSLQLWSSRQGNAHDNMLEVPRAPEVHPAQIIAVDTGSFDLDQEILTIAKNRLAGNSDRLSYAEAAARLAS